MLRNFDGGLTLCPNKTERRQIFTWCNFLFFMYNFLFVFLLPKIKMIKFLLRTELHVNIGLTRPYVSYLSIYLDTAGLPLPS